MRKYSIHKFKASKLLVFWVCLSLILILTTMTKNQANAKVPFVVNDTFSYEELTSFKFEGNITGTYSNAFDNASLNLANYTVHRWMIDKVTGINIKITNITEEDLELEIKQQYTCNSYEEFTINENNTNRRTSSQFGYLSQFNVSISIDDFRVSSTSNESYYPFNITTFFWTQSNLTIGEDLEIIDTIYHVENHSLLATYEGEKNVTNLLSGVVNSEMFAYSDYLQQYVYLGEFANQTLLSVGRYDGILISGLTTSTFIDSLAFTNAAEGEITIETSIDIVSSSYEDPGRAFGSIYWLFGGLIVEAFFIYNFEKNTFKKLRGTQKIDTKNKTAHKEEYVKRLDIYLPHKEQ